MSPMKERVKVHSASRSALVGLLLILVFPLLGTATTFIVPTDEKLVEYADAIVIAIARSSQITEEEQGAIITAYQFEAEEVIKGDVGEIFSVIEKGGILESRAMIIPGTPVYRSGERVLLFLQRIEDQQWRTWQLAVGKFTFVRDAAQREFLMRGSDGHDIFGIDEAGGWHSEGTRLAAPFLQFVRDVTNGMEGNQQYFGNALGSALSPARPVTALSHYPASAYSMSGGWRAQNGTRSIRPSGSQPGLDGLGAATRGAAAWNAAPNASITYTFNNSPTEAGYVADGNNTLVFGVPSSVIGGAAGQAVLHGSGSHVFSGETFISIGESDIAIQENCCFLVQTLLDGVVTHEMGHTLGIRHPEQGTPGEPSGTTNVMRGIVPNSIGANLGPWDQDAASHLFGSGSSTCAPPSITVQPQSTTISSGSSTVLTVGAGGTSPLSYQWYRGNAPSTTQPVGGNSSSLNTGPLTASTSFWVRVTGQCGSPVDSTTVTVVVTTPCTPVSITLQPTSRQITAGTATTLTVSVSGTSPSYQWLQGLPPGGTPVGGNSPSLTVSPGTTTSYRVRVSNACSGAVESAVATVSVCPSSHLCLLNGRFRLALFATDPRSGRTAVGNPVPENEVFGFFSLAELTGSTDIPEVFVKILDASMLPTNPSFWIFYSGLTDVEYTIVVTDTARGIQRQFSKPGYSLCGNVDADAFSLDDLDPAGEMSAEGLSTSSEAEVQPFACGSNSLCLLGGRFDVTLSARNPRNGQTAAGIPVRKNDLFGYFNIVALTGNTQNPEVFVKMIDATSVFGKFLFFHGSLTDFDYTITVKDNQKPFRSPVVYRKAAGIPFCGGAEASFDP